MALTGDDLLARVRRFREVGKLQHESVPSVVETLERISEFLQRHETSSPRDCTHTVFDCYPDWWQSQSTAQKLVIAEDGTLDLLYRYIAILFDLGIPLTLTERRTGRVRLFQDIEILGSRNSCLTAADFLTPDSKFARLLGQTMGEVYPNNDFLDVVVFDASGLARTKGVMKTSVRLVWYSIVVDQERAARIRDFLVHKFKDTQDEDIKAFEAKAQGACKDNQWATIFNDAGVVGRHGVRMPLNDRTSPAPLKKPEGRPLTPYGVMRFMFKDSQVVDIEHRVRRQDLEGVDWLRIGCIRRDEGQPMTEWVSPAWRGDRPARVLAPSLPGGGGGQGGSGYDGASRTPAAVRIHTQGGSDPTCSRPSRSRLDGGSRIDQAWSTSCVEREFDGTPPEFKERLEQQLGDKDTSTITLTETSLVWTQAGDTGARIEFRADNRRVYIGGSAHQIHALLGTLASFVREVGGDGRSVVSSRAGTRRPGSEAGYAPSAVYTPSAVFAPSGAVGGSMSVSTALRGPGGAGGEAVRRVALRDFEAEGEGELDVCRGDCLTVTHDPESAGNNSLHRWVYGENARTQQRGWFPLARTSPQELSPVQ